MPDTINYYGVFRLKWSTYLVLQTACVAGCLIGACGAHRWLRESDWFLFANLWLILLALTVIEIAELLVLVGKRRARHRENEID